MKFVILLTLLAVSASQGINLEEFPGKIGESVLTRERRQNTQINTGNNAKQIMGGRRRRDVEVVEFEDTLLEPLQRDRRQNIQVNTGNLASQVMGRRRRDLEDVTVDDVFVEPLQRESRQANTQVNTGNGATQIMGRKRREIEEEATFVRERRQNTQTNTGDKRDFIFRVGRKRRAALSTKNPEISVNTPTFNAHVGSSGAIGIQNGKPILRVRRQNTQVNTGHGATQIMGGRKRREADFEVEERENFETFNRERRQNSQINTGHGAIQIMGGRKRREAEEEPEILDRQRRQNTQVNTGNLATQIMGRKRRQTIDFMSNSGNVNAHVNPSNVYANVQSPTGNHFSTSLNY